MSNMVAIPEQMRAVIYYGPKDLRLEMVPVPEIKADEMLIKVRSATTCGTDVKTYLRGHPKYPPPFLFGHEFAGDVVQVGSLVEAFAPGMRVTASCFGPCGSCYWCKQHQENLCENMSYNFATYAEYVRLTWPFVRMNTLIVPDNLDYPQAALLEPLASAVHGQRLINVQPGDSVVILGAGSIGLMHLQLARARGAAQVIIFDRNPDRLGYALKSGASQALSPDEVDPSAAVLDLTHGRAGDAVIECAGAKATWELAPLLCRKGGRVLWFGGLPGGTEIVQDAATIHYREIAIYNTHGNSPSDFWEACRMVETGIVKTDYLLSGEMGLSEVEKALELMIAGKAMKISINPEQG